MPEQVVPIRQLADTGVILDTPPVSLPPNAFTNARNVRFRDGAVRKMEGEVNIFDSLDSSFLSSRGELQYIAWWPSPNRTVRDEGYYIFVIEETNAMALTYHAIYAMLPGATIPTRISAVEYSDQGKWQHTLFNGGFTFIINNGIQKPQYITDPQDNLAIDQLELADLPGWDSYEVNETILSDLFNEDENSRVFDTGQLVDFNVNNLSITVGTNDPIIITTEDTAVSGVTPSTDTTTNTTILTFSTTALPDNNNVTINLRSKNPVVVRAAIVRAFGDFLVAGNLSELDPNTDTVVRRLTGVVRSSDVAQPGAIPNNWNPFAAGVSTADEFVIADTGTVQDMVALQGNMYLYTNTSISVMRLTGNTQVPLAVQPVTDQYGALTTDAVLEYDGKHFVIGSDDIYLFGGHPGSIQSVSDARTRRAFLTRLNPVNDNAINLFTLRYAARDEIWICFPSINSIRGECDEAYIWNYRNNTWTIRTLNSVIRGDIGPVPGGGTPSSVITFSGESGTNGIAQVGSYEVQSFDLDSGASVGQAAPEGREEIQTFTVFDRFNDESTGTPRPAINTNAAEEISVTINSMFNAGPDDTPQIYRVTLADSTFRHNVNTDGTPQGLLYGGARLYWEYDAAMDTNPSTGAIDIRADDLDLSTATATAVTEEEFIIATIAAINNDEFPQLTNWTASTVAGNTSAFDLTSDIPGARPFNTSTLSYILHTSMTTNITTTTVTGTGTLNDEFGDELFTTTVTDNGDGTYDYSIATNRDTSFPDSDPVRNLQITVDGTNYPTTGPIDLFTRDSNPITFTANTNEWSLPTGNDAPRYVALDEQAINLSNTSSAMDIADRGLAYNQESFAAGITRSNTDGNYTQTDNSGNTRTYTPAGGSQTNRTINVDVTDDTQVTTLSQITIPAGDINSPFGFFGVRDGRTSRGFNGVIFRIPSGVTITMDDGTVYTGGTGANAGGSVFVTGFLNSVTLNDAAPYRAATEVSFAHAQTIFGTNGANVDVDGHTVMANTDRVYIQGSSQCALRNNTVYTYNQTGNRRWRLVQGSGVGYYLATENFSVLNVEIREGEGHPCNGTSFWMDATLRRPSSITLRSGPGFTISMSVPSRQYEVTNHSTFPITFTPQGQTAFNVAADGGTNTITYTGTEERWSWANAAIDTGTQDGDATADNITVDTTASTITSNTTLYQAGTAAQRSFISGEAKSVQLAFPRGNSGTVDAIRVRDGTAFNSGRTDNNGNNLGLHGFTPTSENMAHSGGTGVATRFNVSWTELQVFNNSTPTITALDGGTLTQQQRASIFGQTRFQAGNQDRHIAYNGTGVIYNNSNNTFCMWNTSSTASGFFSGRHQFGQVYLISNIGAGTITAFMNRNEQSSIASVEYDVTNPHPFPINFTPAGAAMATLVPANTDNQEINREGTDDDWSAVSAATTQYRHTLTNNNLRPVMLTAGTWGMQTIQPSENAVVIDGNEGWSVTGTRRLILNMPMTPAGSSLVSQQSGVGLTDNRMPVGINFMVPFTDDAITDINFDYRFPIGTAVGVDSATEDSIARLYGTALTNNAEVNRYFEVITSDDQDVNSGTINIRARAMSGEMFYPRGDTSLPQEVFPAHDATIFNTLDAITFGGNGDMDQLSYDVINHGQGTQDPIMLNFTTGTDTLLADGTLMRVPDNPVAIVLTGQYDAGDATDQTDGSHKIASVYRRAFNEHALWIASRTNNVVTQNSINDGPHFTRLESIVDPSNIGITREYFQIFEQQQGETDRSLDTDLMYPILTINFPDGQSQMVTLDASSGDLSNEDIVELVEAAMTMDGRTATAWSTQNTASTEIYGEGPGIGERLKFFSIEPRAITGDITFSVNYGNTGATFPPGTTGMVNVFGPSQFGRVTGDANYDFRGAPQVRSVPTRVMVEVTNNNFPVETRTNSDGQEIMVGIQYIPVVIGENSTFDPVTQDTSMLNGTQVDTNTIVLTVRSAIRNANRRVTANAVGNTLTILPVQYSDIASFVLDVFINDSTDNVTRYNEIVMNRMTAAEVINYFGVTGEVATNETDVMNARTRGLINTVTEHGGVQSFAAQAVQDLTSTQANPGTVRMPNFVESSTIASLALTSTIDTVFDALRPWPTTQVNLSREYPIFANSIIDDMTGELSQSFRGADLGFLYLDQPYESFVERIELGLTPEFDTEQLTSLALWGDGGNSTRFGQPIDQATLTIKMYGTNAPGETRGLYSNDSRNVTGMIQRTVDNDFVIGQDYKIDMRIHGRFINYLITDYAVVNNVRVPREAPDSTPETPIYVNRVNDQGITWAISGMQADVMKGGRR